MTKTKKPFAKVVSIIDEFKLVINKGEGDIDVGDLVFVYGIGEELFDPDTNESLGKLELVRGRGRVIHVQEKISTIESASYINKNSRKVRTSGFSIFPPQETEYGEIREQIEFDKPEKGDFVKLI